VVSADADLRIKLPVFEGPLDLLLFLIRKNELDIYDIPIAEVTRQYIEVLRSMQQLDLEIAGEFFVMAASLMEIKSRMLLPRGQAATGESEDDDPLDPRWELVHQLLQYKKFKEAAAKLDELAAFQRDMLPRQVVEVAVTESERPLKPVDRIELWNAFNLVLRRLAEKLVVGEIKGEEVTVSDKMEELLQLIQTRKSFLFTDLFEGKQVTVRLLVATFIAVLELTRLKKLRVRQTEAFADIHVEAVENTVNADGTLAEGQLNFTPEAPEAEAPSKSPAPPAESAETPAPAAPDAQTEVSAVAPPPEAPGTADVAAASATPAADTDTPTPPASSDPAPQPEAIASEEPLAPTPSPEATDIPSAEPPPAEPADTASLAQTEVEPVAAPSPVADAPAPSFEHEPPPASALIPEAAAAHHLPAPSPPSEPPAAFETLPPPLSDAPPPPAEQIPPQNPLDTPPPRDTLAS